MRQSDAGIFDGPWLTGVHPNPVQQRTYYSIMLHVQSSHEETTWFSIKNKCVHCNLDQRVHEGDELFSGTIVVVARRVKCQSLDNKVRHFSF